MLTFDWRVDPGPSHRGLPVPEGGSPDMPLRPTRVLGLPQSIEID